MIFHRLFPSPKKGRGRSISLEASDDRFLFETDPEFFFETLENDDAKRRADAFANRPHDILLSELVRFGTRWSDAEFHRMRDFYYATTDTASPEMRRATLSIISNLIETAGLSAHVLYPFISDEPDNTIVATAVIDFLNFAPVTNNDPIGRAREMIDMAHGLTLRPAAIIGALLHFGDSRVCELIWPLRENLTPEAVQYIVQSCTGFMSAAAVEFELRWLEEMRPGDPMFGTVAAGLINQRRTMKIPEVATGLRPFPDALVSSEEHLASIRRIPIEEYTEKIAPRLYALEQAEPPPRVMPHVLKAWGLEPASSPEETAQL